MDSDFLKNQREKRGAEARGVEEAEEKVSSSKGGEKSGEVLLSSQAGPTGIVCDKEEEASQMGRILQDTLGQDISELSLPTSDFGSPKEVPGKNALPGSKPSQEVSI